MSDIARRLKVLEARMMRISSTGQPFYWPATLAQWKAAYDQGLYCDMKTGEAIGFEQYQERYPERAERVEKARGTLAIFDDVLE